MYYDFIDLLTFFVGIDKKTGVVVERPGPGIRRISGHPILDNHCVNLLSSIIIALVTPKLANLVWV